MCSFKKKAELFKAKMRELKLTKEDCIEMFEELDEDKIEAMVSGQVPYTERMNCILEYITGRVCERENMKRGMRKYFRLSGKKKERYDFINEIVDIFYKETLMRSESDKKVTIRTISEFKQKFRLSKPVTINDFIKRNKSVDNFIVILMNNDVGISGMSMKIHTKGVCFKCIYVNSGEPLGRQVFTFFHEIYHIYVDGSKIESEINITYKDDEIEESADRFAGDIIIDTHDLFKFCKQENMSSHRDVEFDEICIIQKKFGVTFQYVMYKIDNVRKLVISKGKEEVNDKKHIILKYLPIIPENFYKYYNEKYWKQLELKILDNDPSNKYNSSTNKNLVL